MVKAKANTLVTSATTLNFLQDIPQTSRSGRKLRKRERFLILARRAMRLNESNVESLKPRPIGAVF